MQQGRMIALAEKMQQMVGSVYVHGQSIPEVGIEIRQPGAVDDQIKRAPQALAYIRCQAKPGLARIACDDFDPLAKEIGEAVAVQFGEPVEYGRLRDHAFEALQRRRRAMATNQKMN